MAENLTVQEVAKLMRVSNMTVYRLVRTNKLGARKFGRQIRIPVPALEAYLRESLADYRQRYVTGPVDL